MNLLIAFINIESKTICMYYVTYTNENTDIYIYIYIYIYINTYTPHTLKYKTLYQQPTSISGFALKLGAKD